MKRRVSEIVESTRSATNTLIGSLPDGKLKANSERVAEICQALVCLRPSREPTGPVVAEEGGVRFEGFPTERTLYNCYREILRLWRQAYLDIRDIGAGPLDVAAGLREEHLGPLDAGTRSNVLRLLDLLHWTQMRNNRLSNMITGTIPLDGASTPSIPNVPEGLKDELARWLERLDSGALGLDADDTGVALSRRGRVGTHVMSATLLSLLRQLATGCPPLDASPSGASRR